MEEPNDRGCASTSASTRTSGAPDRPGRRSRVRHPEYNYGYPATIKNAIDYLSQEWKDKPAGFVSYGGIAAGTRAVGSSSRSSPR